MSETRFSPLVRKVTLDMLNEALGDIGDAAELAQTHLQTFNNAKILGAAGDGATDDTAAIKAGYVLGNVYLPYGTYLVSDPTLITDPTRYSGPGYFKYDGGLYPAEDVVNAVTLPVPSVFPTLQSAVTWAENKKICNEGFVTIQVADGTYNLSQIECHFPLGKDRVQIIGNQAAPANCILNFNNTGGACGFVFKHGSGINLIDGFTINGAGGWQSHGVWASNAFGYAIGAEEGSYAVVGGNMVINKFYYGIKAQNSSVIYCLSGLQVYEAGDCCYHAYGASAIYANNCEAFSAADTAQGLGAGFVAEGSSFIDCSFSSAQSCGTDGFLALNGSGMWAHSCTSSKNGAAGFHAAEGSMMECNNASTDAKTNSFQNTGDGYRSEAGSTMNCNSCQSTSNGGNGFYALGQSYIDATASSSSQNTADGYSVYLGSTLSGKSLNAYNNGGNGLHANTNSTIFTGDYASANNNGGWGYYATLLSSITITGTEWGAAGNTSGQLSPSTSETIGNASSYVTTPDSDAQTSATTTTTSTTTSGS